MENKKEISSPWDHKNLMTIFLEFWIEHRKQGKLMIKRADESIERLVSEHDCHAGPESGCAVCDLINRPD